MKIDITNPPDPDIFRNRKKYILWFLFFMFLVITALGLGGYSVYSGTENSEKYGDLALGILLGASIGITWFGNRLQSYKKLFPPQIQELSKLRTKHPNIATYCGRVEAAGRRLIRAEYEACVEYSETHSAAPFI